MTAQIITFADDNMRLDEALALAERAGMYLISNGQRAVISPVIPKGWEKIGARDKAARLQPKAA